MKGNIQQHLCSHIDSTETLPLLGFLPTPEQAGFHQINGGPAMVTFFRNKNQSQAKGKNESYVGYG